MLAVAAQRSEAVFAKTMRSRVVKFEENLIDNDNWRHGVKYSARLFALKNSSDQYSYIHTYYIHTSVRHCICTHSVAKL